MTFRISHSLQLRFILPVSALVIVLVLGGAFAFSFSEGKRIETEITRHTEEQAHGVTDLLGLTDALIMQQVQGAMKVLIERGGTFGTAALGPSVRVKDKTVPDLLFGSKPQANQFDLVDGVTKAVGGTATLFVKSGDEFVRISTNVKRDGERAIGTVLDPKGKVIAAIRAGQAYYGKVDILGDPYLTGYEPIRNAKGDVVGIWYIGYKVDMRAGQHRVDEKINERHGCHQRRRNIDQMLAPCFHRQTVGNENNEAQRENPAACIPDQQGKPRPSIAEYRRRLREDDSERKTAEQQGHRPDECHRQQQHEAMPDRFQPAMFG